MCAEMAIPANVDPVNFMLGEAFQMMDNDFKEKVAAHRKEHDSLMPGDDLVDMLMLPGLRGCKYPTMF